jgi:hypothetical protein
MKMPRGIFITYVCDVIGSSAVNMKTVSAVFMLLFACVLLKSYPFYRKDYSVRARRSGYANLSGLYQLPAACC